MLKFILMLFCLIQFNSGDLLASVDSTVSSENISIEVLDFSSNLPLESNHQSSHDVESEVEDDLTDEYVPEPICQFFVIQNNPIHFNKSLKLTSASDFLWRPPMQIS